jgi:regulator of protease activity HflC (stomatin/prohibitin superfamily)
METALGWIGQLVEWIGQFIPRFKILPPTHQAIVYDGWQNKTYKCESGFVWWWPVRHFFDDYPTARQTTDLKVQTLMTKDHKTTVISGMIAYEVADVEALVAHTFEPDQAIQDICLGVIHDVVKQRTWEQLNADNLNGELDRALRKEAKRQLEKYGVRVLKLSLTDFGLCRVYRVL